MKPRDPFRLVTTTAGVLAGGVLGCSAHLLFASMHKGARTLDFLAITWILAGTVGAFTYGYHRRRRWPFRRCSRFGSIEFVGSFIGFAILQGVVKWFTSPGWQFATSVMAITVGWLAWVTQNRGRNSLYPSATYLDGERDLQLCDVPFCCLRSPPYFARNQIIAASHRQQIQYPPHRFPRRLQRSRQSRSRTKSNLRLATGIGTRPPHRQGNFSGSRRRPDIEAIYRQATYHQALDSFRRFQAQGDRIVLSIVPNMQFD